MATSQSDTEPGAVANALQRGRTHAKQVDSWFAGLRERVPIVDVGARVVERDKEAAGTLLGSALALRLFSFFVPLVLVVAGIAGLLGSPADGSAAAETAGLTATLADYVGDAFTASGTTPWIAVAIGLVGVATTGRSLTRALVLSSALSWRMGGKQRTPVRLIGLVVGLVVGFALSAAILNRINLATGIAVTSVSVLGSAAFYVVLWVLLFQALPRSTSDPGAALPGSVLIAVVLSGLQAITQFWLPHQIDSSTQLYGQIGVVITVLGWFFILGRVIAFSCALNAVIYERLGSLSGLVFGLPIVREIPRRIPAVGRYFALDHVTGGDRDKEAGASVGAESLQVGEARHDVDPHYGGPGTARRTRE
jgi:uncharacterized BrkB/YihY/UPF0761 family membrane protein